MNVNAYLPDELGWKAKLEDLNLSRLLRDAVERRLTLIQQHADKEAVAQALKGAGAIELQVENENGNVFTLEFVGVPLSDLTDHVYLVEDGTVLVYDESKQKVRILEDPVEDLRGLLSTDEYVSTLGMLGYQPRLTLDDLRG